MFNSHNKDTKHFHNFNFKKLLTLSKQILYIFRIPKYWLVLIGFAAPYYFNSLIKNKNITKSGINGFGEPLILFTWENQSNDVSLGQTSILCVLFSLGTKCTNRIQNTVAKWLNKILTVASSEISCSSLAAAASLDEQSSCIWPFL